MKAAEYFGQPKDSLKLKALNFILKNMSDQFFMKGEWVDIYNISILNQRDNSVNDLIFKLDSIRYHHPSSLLKIYDYSVIDNTYLIKNIERAFNSRKYKWSKEVSFSEFCEYILPYKIGNERPEQWGMCLEQENYLKEDSISHFNDVFEVTSYVNDHLNWFKGSVNYDYPLDVGFKMSRFIATGTCYSMSKMALYEMRSVGLPVVIDYAPSWGNRNAGHYWNALIKNGIPYPLDPTGPNIGFYKIGFKGVGRMTYKVSKVFRQTFSLQENSLAFINDSNEQIPPIFNSKRVKDVTNQYVPTSNLILNYAHKLSRKFGYLYTFDDRNWIPSFWGKVNNKQIFFQKMGRDVVYLPALYYDVKNISPIGNPFILTKEGRTIELKPNKKRFQRLMISKKYPEDETNNIYKGSTYELFYWDAQWKSLGIQIAKGKKLYFTHAPVNALYLLKNLTKGKQERIFTYENDQQIWW